MSIYTFITLFMYNCIFHTFIYLYIYFHFYSFPHTFMYVFMSTFIYFHIYLFLHLFISIYLFLHLFISTFLCPYANEGGVFYLRHQQSSSEWQCWSFEATVTPCGVTKRNARGVRTISHFKSCNITLTVCRVGYIGLTHIAHMNRNCTSTGLIADTWTWKRMKVSTINNNVNAVDRADKSLRLACVYCRWDSHTSTERGEKPAHISLTPTQA